jgi:excisionase family DNA binding protein
VSSAADARQRAAEIATLVGKLAALLTSDVEDDTPPRQVPVSRVLLTVQEAAERLGIGRSLMYDLLRSGEVESVRIGRLRRVPVGAVDSYATSLLARSRDGAGAQDRTVVALITPHGGPAA